MEHHGSFKDTSAIRSHAIRTVVDEFVLATAGAMKSERACSLIKKHEYQIRRLLKQVVHEMFTSFEKVLGASCTDIRLV